jgi:hypothetical protein
VELRRVNEKDEEEEEPPCPGPRRGSLGGWNPRRSACLRRNPISIFLEGGGQHQLKHSHGGRSHTMAKSVGSRKLCLPLYLTLLAMPFSSVRLMDIVLPTCLVVGCVKVSCYSCFKSMMVSFFEEGLNFKLVSKSFGTPEGLCTYLPSSYEPAISLSIEETLF